MTKALPSTINPPKPLHHSMDMNLVSKLILEASNTSQNTEICNLKLIELNSNSLKNIGLEMKNTSEKCKFTISALKEPLLLFLSSSIKEEMILNKPLSGNPLMSILGSLKSMKILP